MSAEQSLARCIYSSVVTFLLLGTEHVWCVETKSMEEFGATAPVLTKQMCKAAYERLVQHPDEQKSELIDVNHAPTFKNLPPAYVVTAEYDVLRDEGEYFAARLFRNNVPVSAFLLLCSLL